MTNSPPNPPLPHVNPPGAAIPVYTPPRRVSTNPRMRNMNTGRSTKRNLKPVPAKRNVLVEQLVYAPTMPVLSPQERQNHRRMLARVRETWIAGVLDQSLYVTVGNELGLKSTPDMRANPRLVLEQPYHPAQPLPAAISVTHIYDKTSGSLLILGAPGAGKTTLLLQLACDLLDRAEGDENLPIPVVLHLSSWADKCLPFADWLVRELEDKYLVPGKVGQQWIDKDHLLLLLDGLDEVSAPHRRACVKAIKAYRQEHRGPRVVCSSEREYRKLSIDLAINYAIVVQPLTLAQIDDYLASGGSALVAIREGLQTNQELRDLLDTPLMLNVLTLAYEGVSVGIDLPTSRQQIFAAYVERMMTRLPATSHYSPQQTQHWLNWLARQMVQRSQTVFHMDWLHPDWLPGSLTAIYKVLASLVFILLGWQVIGLGSRVLGVGGVIFGVLLHGVYWGLNYLPPRERTLWSWAELEKSWLKVLGLGLGGGLVGLIIGWMGSVLGGVLVGLLGGVLWGGLSDELLDKHHSRPNQAVWQAARIGLVSGPVGLSCGLVFGLPIGILFGLLVGLRGGWVSCIQHLLLRLLLWFSGCMPLNYVRFLDVATEQHLLMRAGGGYLFTHRLLLEYFAEQEA